MVEAGICGTLLFPKDGGMQDEPYRFAGQRPLRPDDAFGTDNTGARVQELADIKVRDVRSDPPPILTLIGQRPQDKTGTADVKYVISAAVNMTDNCLLTNGMQDRPLFVN